LAAARTELLAADTALAEARAEIGDLETTEGAGPALARQIAKLEKRLSFLTYQCEDAARKVAQIETQRSTLRDRAPQWLKQAVNRDTDAIRMKHPSYAARDAIAGKLDLVEKVLRAWNIEGRVDPACNKFEPNYQAKNWLYIAYARRWFPEAYEENEKDSCQTRVNITKFSQHVDWLKSVEYPRLLAERERLTAEWEQTVAEISQPIERWVQTGEVN
jgi:hypothetical protein